MRSPALARRLAALALSAAPAVLARGGAPPPPAFCAAPPVVPGLDLAAYAAGVWYQLAASGAARAFGSFPCATANYSLRADGAVDVLNCGIIGDVARPSCLVGVAAPREGATEAAALTVAFPPAVPPASYSVAALLGDAAEGYSAAVVYQCSVGPGGETLPGYFVISRTPARDEEERAAIFDALKESLVCSGYDVDVEFFDLPHGCDCRYFFEDDGFQVLAGPPPGVDISGGGGPPPGVDISGGGGPPPGVVAAAGPPPGVTSGGA